MELVRKPLRACQALKLAPNSDTVQELHELCGGDPAEIQLYCHHMYRTIEDGFATTMSLSPRVFREVLREYRSISPADTEAILNAIERLPDKLLFQSRWLARRALSRDENVSVEILREELNTGRELTTSERDTIASEISAGYNTLFAAGITELDNYIRLAGAPLTAGFWKSYVEVEKRERWTWDDNSFAENIRQLLATAIGRGCGAATHIELSFEPESIETLQRLRDGKKIEELDEDSVMEMVVSALIAKDVSAKTAFDVGFHIESAAGRQTFTVRYLERETQPLKSEAFEHWVVTNTALLNRNNINLSVSEVRHWILPTALEMQRLGRIAEIAVPESLGPREIDTAVDNFKNGRIEETAALFERMLDDKEDEQIRNNLAFCQILLGQLPQAKSNLERAISIDYEPLFGLNLAIVQILSGDETTGKSSLEFALNEIRKPGSKFDGSELPLYVLVLNRDKASVTHAADLPIDAAILINQAVTGDLSKGSLLPQLAELYPDKHSLWLSLLESRIE
jgi:hypothetical protein